MFIRYIVTNYGRGLFCTTENDICCNPSECFWLVPDAKSPLWADPDSLSPFEPGDLATAKDFDSGVVREVCLVRRESEFRSAFGRTRKPPTGEWLCFFKQEGEHPAGWIAASELRKVKP